MKRLGLFSLLFLFVLAACSTEETLELGTLLVDVTPDNAYVTVLSDGEVIDYGYGDVRFQDAYPGTFEIIAGLEGETVTTTVELGMQERVTVRLEVREEAHEGVTTQSRTSVSDEDDSDSDRPPWAGRDGDAPKPGGGNKGGDKKKGGDYGDLWVLKRDSDGAPVLHPDTGCVIPLAADGTEITLVVSTDGPAPKCEPAPEDAELVQEVEFGRLNFVRAPKKVLDRAFDEAMSLLTASEDVLTTDAAGHLVAVIDGAHKTIDSPLENVALYKRIMETDGLPGVTLPREPLDTAASLFAAGADKTGDITLDEVVYINGFLGLNDDADGYTHYRPVSYNGLGRFGDVEATVLVQAGEGTWEVQTVNVFETVFGNTDAEGSNARGFTQAADDALQVIEYIHEYAVPTGR